MLESLSFETISSLRRPFAPIRALLVLGLILFVCHSGYGQTQGQDKSKPYVSGSQRKPTKTRSIDTIPAATLVAIVRAEDERRWDATLASLLINEKTAVRHRAALAAGRIGDARAVPALSTLLVNDRSIFVRAMAAFALGEIESALAADALLAALDRNDLSNDTRARSVEALGKIAAALPEAEKEKKKIIADKILAVLSIEAERGTNRRREVVLKALTAVLRSAPDGAGKVLIIFLSDADPRVRADAGNTMTRLKVTEGGDQLRNLLMGDPEAVVRANAARALGAAQNKEAFELLVTHANSDPDERVRVSSIRALGALKDARAVGPLLQRGASLFSAYQAARELKVARPPELNELLDLVTALSRLLANTGDARALALLRSVRSAQGWLDPETEIAFARIAPSVYVREKPFDKLSDEATRTELFSDWRRASSLAQGLNEIATLTAEAAGNSVIGIQADAQLPLRALLDDKRLPALSRPDVLNALLGLKPNDAGEILRRELKADDVVVRDTAAQWLGELPPDEANTTALIEAFPGTSRDELNDAALAILDSLAKQKNSRATEAIKSALDSTDYLVRRRAVALLKAGNAGDFSARISTVASRNSEADYARALARRNGRTRAFVTTEKGEVVIELLPDEAPLTVDSFVQLARRGYFNGITFHRVVPNFVIQGGDPRGDGNGGPGYQIRCEINLAEFDRGAVGMALSGKDTGGSQWFVTHSPQPHLDGGYTVFGTVKTNDMNVVDGIVRGDRIISIRVEDDSRAGNSRRK